MRSANAIGRWSALLFLFVAAHGARAEEEGDDEPALEEAARPAPERAVLKLEVPRIAHVPVASAPADVDLRVTAEITAADRMAEATLHYRRRGEAGWHLAPLQRSARADWEALIPASEMAPGIIEYWLSLRPSTPVGAALEPRFASPASPHVVIVVGDREARWRKELLAAHLGNHSRMQVQSELVDFGARLCAVADNCSPDVAGRRFDDYYWRVEGDYTYRILGWVYSIRLGAGVLRGATWEGSEDGNGQMVLTAIPHAGLTYGFAELRFRFGRVVRMDLRATLGAGPEHFDGGAGAALVIGNEPGTNFSFGVDGVTSVGVRGFLKLAWNTVPRLPMSLTLEVTNLPSNTDARGRVYLGVGYRVHRYFLVNAQIGYAARDFHVGGPSAGLGAAVEF